MHTNIEALQNIRDRLHQRHPHKVAHEANMSRSAVRSIRNGLNLNPPLGTLYKLDVALDKLEKQL